MNNYSTTDTLINPLQQRFEELERKFKSLEKEKAHLQELYNQAPLGYQLLDAEGNFLDVNQTWLETLGYYKEEVIGKNFSNFLKTEGEPEFNNVFAQFKSVGQLFNTEFELVRKDHSTIKVSCQGIVSEEPQTELQRTHCVFKNITEETQAKKLLGESETNYQLLVNNQTDILTKMDIRGTLLFVSPSYCKMFNKTEEEVLGKKIGHLIHEEDRVLTEEAFQHISQPPYTSNYQQRALTRDGWRWFSWQNTAILDEHGNCCEVISVGRDISNYKDSEEERKRLQDQLSQTQKMDAVGRLAGVVAHDYNNMLNVIIGHTEIALDDFSIHASLRLSLEQILSAAHRSSDITRQILAFAKQQTIISTVVNLNNIIENLLPMAKRLLDSKITLTWSPEADLWDTEIDPAQIDQILLNLCINARDAISEYGEIVIETRNTILDDESCPENQDTYPGDFVTILVQDTGRGIAKEKLNHIFEPFYTTKETGQGTGLGLATVYGIIAQNKGFINVYSKLSEGTSFEIYIPRHEKTSAAPPPTEPTNLPMGQGEVILIVEDEPAILNLGKRVLEKLGYAVIAASSPREALSWVKEHSTHIDLLLTDVVMPHMDGKEMADKIQEIYPHLKNKTLYMSGYTSDVFVNRGILSKEIPFIQKPFTKNGLAIQVREVLDKE